MRAGACAAQQTLSAEAAAVLKHSLSLARRRGHAQVTPLHVAATLLTSRASLLRRACLKSQPPHPSHHPLQCRALELCFNVALNRLPASPGPLLHAQPSLSNALIAALKRAQAHQRRGCIEQHHQQQPPLIAIKVELEQLILSILDDPSVSRVMREAGFSSTSVKINLDDCTNSVFQCYNASGGIYSTPSSPPAESHRPVPLINPAALWQAHLFDQNPFLLSPHKKPSPVCMSDGIDSSSLKEDIKLVLEVLVGRRRRRNTVIVGDSISMAEALVAEVMTLVEKGDVPDELKSAQLVKFQFSSVPIVLMNKEEVDMNVADLKRKVDSFASVGRVIIYIGDLKWAVDERERGFCSDHLIAEIGKLVAWYNASNMKVWLMATANYQTYVKCQMKQPPLDVQWALQPVSVPSGGLGLSLNAATSGRDSRIAFSENSSPVSDKKVVSLKEETDFLTCCQECTSNYEKEAAFNKSFSDKETASPQLPYWLKPHSNHTLDCKDDLDQLRRKYNKICQSLHQGSQNPHSSSHLGRNYYSTSSYPSWLNKNSILLDSETISFACPTVKPNQGASTLPRFRRQQSCHIEFSFSNGASKNRSEEPNLDPLKMIEDNEVRITLALGNSMYTDEVKRQKIVLCDLLKANVPWQLEAIPPIIDALMNYEANNHDKFLLIQGNDNVAKRRIAVAAAESIFGSSDLLLCMNMRNSEKTAAENLEMMERALRKHEKLVVLVEDVEFADPELAKFLADGFEARSMRDNSGRAIFILTTDAADATAYNTNSVIPMKLVVQESTTHAQEMANLDHKRKADWDYSPIATGRSKSRRSNEMEEVTSNATTQLKMQLSSNGLDLNIRADEDEVKEGGKPGEFSPISSDLTREIAMEPLHNSLTFLKEIKNRFVLNRGSDQDKQAREMFLYKLRRSFDEASGCTDLNNLKVEEKVLEQVLGGSGLYLNSSFEEWLKDIFQTSLGAVNSGERVRVRLCLVGEGESCAEDGFMGTCLPKRIPVSYIGC
ncbi:hypothetical protein C2S53_020029 [Perilla frutescens var. hirtella]|uniref:Clp R domain-containing protein n=1 Tax=Perilla frutescens var. hirtella TaxID=608512 RepID=A0AAD4NWB0_PERFH|nr:hypothetical protein C2S53_020029 [Perilla frutescens var. hirtella]